MKSKFKDLISLSALSVVTVGFLLCRCIKISPIVGAHFTFFSLSDVLMPLSGVASLWFGALMVVFRIAYRVFFLSSPLSNLVYHLPGFCASAYWAYEGVMIRLILPLVCMALFLAHPIGWQAAPYSLYWFIPVVLYFFPRKTIFLTALGSTFIAHAVGSVIWMYSFDLTVAAWLALIPVVAVERLLFASSMTVLYAMGSFIKEAVVNFYTISIGYKGSVE